MLLIYLLYESFPYRQRDTYLSGRDHITPLRGAMKGMVVKDPRHGSHPSGKLAALDDADAALFTVGQAADAVGTRPATLRRLDAAGVVSPGRSSGGQRRYSRRQIERAARVQSYVADGTSVALAGHIVDLEDEVSSLREQLSRARRRPHTGPDQAGPDQEQGPATGPGRLPGPRRSGELPAARGRHQAAHQPRLA